MCRLLLKSKYSEVLDLGAVEGNYIPFIQFVAGYEQHELQPYLE